MITHPFIAQYTEKYSSPESQILAELNKETQKLPGAQMISGHLQGQFLQLISKIIQPEYILEIGTFTGYSAICLAEGLKENGILHTIDNDEQHEALRNKYWEKAKLKDKIKQHIGNAEQVVKDLNISFDLVFIDADKKNYINYFEQVLPMMKSGAIILADNVLFKSEIILNDQDRSKTARYMDEFNQKIAKDERVEQIILPLRDGISMIRKK